MKKITINDIQHIVQNVLTESLLLEKQRREKSDSNTAVKKIRKFNKQLYKSKTLFEYIYNLVRKTAIGNKINLSIYNKTDDATKSSITRYMSVFCTLDICQGNIIDGYYKIGKNPSEKMMPYEYAKKYLNSHDSTVGKFNREKNIVRSKICTNSSAKIKKAELEIEKNKNNKIEK